MRDVCLACALGAVWSLTATAPGVSVKPGSPSGGICRRLEAGGAIPMKAGKVGRCSQKTRQVCVGDNFSNQLQPAGSKRLAAQGPYK